MNPDDTPRAPRPGEFSEKTNEDPVPAPGIPPASPETMQIGYYGGPPPRPFKGERTGSIVCGIIALILAVGSGCAGVVTPISLAAPHSASVPAPRLGAIMSAMLYSLAMSAGLAWIGIGAIRLQRWVRPVVLILSTLMLVAGVGAIFNIFAFSPQIRQNIRASQNGTAPPAEFVLLGMILMITFLVVLMLVLPGAMIWFYRRPQVKQMLEHYDPRPRWTDSQPLPVIGLSMTLALWCVSMLLAVPANIVTAFGTVLTGVPAGVVQVAEAATTLLLAWLTYRRRPSGWWGTIGFVLFWTIAFLATAMRSNQFDLYRRAGYTETEVSQLAGLASRGNWIGPMVIACAMLAYLAYVSRYFPDATSAQKKVAWTSRDSTPPREGGL